MGFSAQWTCVKCGRTCPKDKSKLHECLLDEYVAYQKKIFEARVEVIGAEHYLTPREKRKLAFERWCVEHGRL